MVTKLPDPDDQLREQLVSYGYEQAKMMWQQGMFSAANNFVILDWLKAQEIARAEAAKQSAANQEALTKSANYAAWIAAWAALAALFVSGIGVAAQFWLR